MFCCYSIVNEISYAYEYLSIKDELDGINDVTLTFIREGQPIKLMKWLEAKGYVKQNSPQ